ncbi:MAG: cysteine--1-D-myo-inosityl 2-amino-2-deoxy-alpha-D-glucopyranoside ligase, partial [Microbacteriaceae bacterium]|nr:cysteine--1-D-myo-inosityl 2-amino-2-deoxy-alpha-D-glucopyranoside ligase [Microbacteriaceae bacterium]
IYSHAGMIAYEGEKMSKSLGNLVLVSRLVQRGADPRAIRLALLGHHYRHDWEWTDDALVAADRRLTLWRDWAEREQPDAQATDSLTSALRAALSDDLDTVAALDAVDRAVSTGQAPDTGALDAVHALLGIDLRS